MFARCRPLGVVVVLAVLCAAQGIHGKQTSFAGRGLLQECIPEGSPYPGPLSQCCANSVPLITKTSSTCAPCGGPTSNKCCAPEQTLPPCVQSTAASDRPGGVITTSTTRTPALCFNACIANKRGCVYFTWDSVTSLCTLKSNTAGAVVPSTVDLYDVTACTAVARPAAGLPDCVIQTADTDIPGADINGGPLAATAEICYDKCVKAPTCMFFKWDPANNKCWMKSYIADSLDRIFLPGATLYDIRSCKPAAASIVDGNCLCQTGYSVTQARFRTNLSCKACGTPGAPCCDGAVNTGVTECVSSLAQPVTCRNRVCLACGTVGQSPCPTLRPGFSSDKCKLGLVLDPNTNKCANTPPPAGQTTGPVPVVATQDRLFHIYPGTTTATVVLDGSPSYTLTPGAKVSQYSWQNEQMDVVGSASTVTLKISAIGTYDITLTVTDDSGASMSVTTQYTVARYTSSPGSILKAYDGATDPVALPTAATFAAPVADGQPFAFNPTMLPADYTSAVVQLQGTIRIANGQKISVTGQGTALPNIAQVYIDKKLVPINTRFQGRTGIHPVDLRVAMSPLSDAGLVVGKASPFVGKSIVNLAQQRPVINTLETGNTVRAGDEGIITGYLFRRVTVKVNGETVATSFGDSTAIVFQWPAVAAPGPATLTVVSFNGLVSNAITVTYA